MYLYVYFIDKCIELKIEFLKQLLWLSEIFCTISSFHNAITVNKTLSDYLKHI